MRSVPLALLPALLLAAPLGLARAGETWIDANPSAMRMAWREGSVSAQHEGERPYQRITTDGKGNPNLVLSAAPLSPPVDARGRFVKVMLRVHDFDRLGHLEVRLGSAGQKRDWFAFPVELFADHDYNFVQEGEWMPVTLSFGEAQIEGAPDRAQIDSIGIVVRDQGKGAVDVDFGGWSLVEEPKQGVVSFTFDDAWADDLTAARMMAAHKMRGTAYIIPNAVGRPHYMTLDEVRSLARMGWEIAAHHETPLTDFEPAALDAELRKIQRYLVEIGFAPGALHFAYPNGKQEPRRVRPEVRRVFETARLAGSGPETLPPADPSLLRAINVINGTPPEQVGGWARRAREHHEWLILMMHRLPEKPVETTDYAVASFAKLLDEVAKSGVRVAPVLEVWKECCAAPGRAFEAEQAMAHAADGAAHGAPAAPASP
jgi:peptidoglycan/xylan/chitin deacetylase (PgdA/CDA1 family)